MELFVCVVAGTVFSVHLQLGLFKTSWRACQDLMSPRTTAEVRFMENSPLLYIHNIQNFNDHARSLGKSYTIHVYLFI